MIYETDTDLVRVWNGSAWRNIAAAAPTQGTVLQVVYAQSTTQATSTTTTFATTNLSASITPQSTSSKILVLTAQPFLASVAYTAIGMRLVRGATVVWSTNSTNYFVTDTGTMSNIFYLDSPSTISAATYTVEFNRVSGSGTAYVQLAAAPANMVLMEVSA
jgi:hypothetical protein